MAALNWYTKRGRALTSAPFLVAGIINVTPDSFSDGGKNYTVDSACASIVQMIKEGADCIDIGAESTRPGATDIGQQEEQNRLAGVFSYISTLPLDLDACFSLDTFRAATAAWALEQKCINVINDISGGTLDPSMDDVLGHFKPGYVLGHCPCAPAVMQVKPKYTNVVDTLLEYFTKRINALVKAGLPETHIAIDPCIGFAKNLEHNLEIIRSIDRLLLLGRPLYFGISRKSLFKDLFESDIASRNELTQILTAILATKGVFIHRVHEVGATVKTLRLVEQTR